MGSWPLNFQTNDGLCWFPGVSVKCRVLDETRQSDFPEYAPAQDRRGHFNKPQNLAGAAV